ncbi:HPr family phosphocarrier protein [Eubacterium maltosivorans]|uniref:Phosphocarrier protein HPr n=1 Tax=Eubacterium maltosivorans TaxID=2041044 RepID=A0A4P9CBM9_EUBML|nr:HPr family phosphocarrier protein [Eubacterium maltosivorans]QCT72933.1 HPr family phosphocarrier protein [Eubacterium maltosivorans]
MVNKVVTITNATGLHARPASMFVQTAGKYRSKIEVVKGDARLNAKSIMGIMSGGIAQGTTVTIEADGEDEQEALEALVALVQSNFGEK